MIDSGSVGKGHSAASKLGLLHGEPDAHLAAQAGQGRQSVRCQRGAECAPQIKEGRDRPWPQAGGRAAIIRCRRRGAHHFFLLRRCLSVFFEKKNVACCGSIRYEQQLRVYLLHPESYDASFQEHIDSRWLRFQGAPARKQHPHLMVSDPERAQTASGTPLPALRRGTRMRTPSSKVLTGIRPQQTS